MDMARTMSPHGNGQAVTMDGGILPPWVNRLLPGKWARLSTVWVGEVTVTPANAEELLRDHNNKNRPLSASRAEAIAGRIVAGGWKLTGETIIFDTDGQVQSAQHRLKAVVDSGVPVQTLAVWGVSPDVFAVVDDGAKKMVRDRLAVAGYKNGTTAAAAGSLINVWLATGRIGRPSFSEKHLSEYAQVAVLLERYPDIMESVRFADGHRPAVNLVHPFGGSSQLAALHWICSHPGPEGRRVVELMAQSVLKSFTPPAWPWVNTLTMRLKDSREPITNAQRIHYALRFFNAYMEGRSLAKATSKWDDTPRVYGWAYTADGVPVPQ